MTYLDLNLRLPELLLMRVDKISMATSVESRVPFLDHRLVEYSMHIPRTRKLHQGETKYILKKAVEGIIPNEIIYRPKQGFSAPVDEWIRGEWYGFVKDLFERSPLIREGFMNREFVNDILQGHHSGKRRAGQLVWNLTNLLLWYERWFQGHR